jgi:hypothetical protein
MLHRRTYDPVEAAYAIAQYFPADPKVWLDRCALAGIRVSVTNDDRLCTLYSFGPNFEYRADPTQITFLESWLNLTPGGKSAVIALVKARDDH